MSDLSNIKLIERQKNIETYTANMKIIIKKFIAKDINEALLFKMKLLENKKTRKIYDIREDKNILYIFIALDENINDLLLGCISKEAITKGHCDPIKKKELSHLFKYEESMCKLRYHKIINNELSYVYGSGFFLAMDIRGLPFKKCLITNNHVLNEDFFKTNKEIEMEYINEIKIIKINKREIYTDKVLDYTCIEIYDSDNIKRFFLINQQILINKIDKFINKDIFILQYPKGEDISFSEGKILPIYNEDIFAHNCSTLKGSSGSPIILREDSTVIGLHHSSFNEKEKNKNNSYNLSTSILSIIKNILKIRANNQIFIKQNNFTNFNVIYNQNKGINYFVAEYSIDEQSIYQNIKIINSYEQYKRENPNLIFNKNKENEKELIENCKIEIKGKIIPFSYYYQFKDKKVRIKYIFTKNIRKMNYLFCRINHLESIDLSNFNAKNVANMDYMFYNCNSLISINLSNCNAQNATTMEYFLSKCESLKSINLSNFNAQNVNNMAYMFYDCKSTNYINLSNFIAQKVINMEYMFSGCKSLKSINLSNFNTQNVNNMAYMFYDCNSLTSIELSNFNSKNVNNMAYMFYGCKSINYINLSNFIGQNVINMEYMFSGCESLKSINLSNFIGQKVINMEYMFSGCKSLKSINLANFKIQKETNMENIFNGCNSLISINLSKSNFIFNFKKKKKQ